MTRNPGAGMDAITAISHPGIMEIVAEGTMTSNPSGQGLVGSVSDLITAFTSNEAFVNVHTQMHNHGEICGQVGPMK